MIKSAKARTPILALILFVFGVGYTFAANKVVVIPMAADSVPQEALPLAYAYTSGSSMYTSYGMAAFSRASDVHTFTLSNSFSGYPVVVATALNTIHDTEIITYYFTAPDKIHIRVVDEENDPVISGLSVVVYGNRL